jgi:hypothetical protein
MCPVHNIEWTFTADEWDIINEENSTNSEESDNATDIIAQMSEIIDQSTIPDRIRNSRIEHKNISIGPNGYPRIEVTCIPARYANAYMNRMFGTIQQPPQPFVSPFLSNMGATNEGDDLEDDEGDDEDVPPMATQV